MYICTQLKQSATDMGWMDWSMVKLEVARFCLSKMDGKWKQTCTSLNSAGFLHIQKWWLQYFEGHNDNKLLDFRLRYLFSHKAIFTWTTSGNLWRGTATKSQDGHASPIQLRSPRYEHPQKMRRPGFRAPLVVVPAHQFHKVVLGCAMERSTVDADWCHQGSIDGSGSKTPKTLTGPYIGPKCQMGWFHSYQDSHHVTWACVQNRSFSCKFSMFPPSATKVGPT